MGRACGPGAWCSPAGPAAQSQAAGTAWARTAVISGSSGAGLRPGKASGSGQGSAPHRRLAGGLSPQPRGPLQHGSLLQVGKERGERDSAGREEGQPSVKEARSDMARFGRVLSVRSALRPSPQQGEGITQGVKSRGRGPAPPLPNTLLIFRPHSSPRKPGPVSLPPCPVKQRRAERAVACPGSHSSWWVE